MCKISEFKMAELLNEGILLGMGNPLLGKEDVRFKNICFTITINELIILFQLELFRIINLVNSSVSNDFIKMTVYHLPKLVNVLNFTFSIFIIQCGTGRLNFKLYKEN